jgi:hypothetical protein
MAVPKDVVLELPLWVIWSEEHQGWLAPGEAGYTRDLAMAGRYRKERALEIEFNANRYVRAPDFHEVALRDPLHDLFVRVDARRR